MKPRDAQSHSGPDDETQMTPSDALGSLSLSVGRQVASFEIIELLGRGGFGEVYRAKDVSLGREVALKFVLDPLSEKQRTLFEREAKALARLSKHPNIVEIYTWGELGSRCYFALEFVPYNLSALLRKNPGGLPPALGLSLVLECAEALAEAHEGGVLHRDIKPANILLETEEGPAKIADFGLTRLLDDPERSIIMQSISGSPPYMSPEQAAGETVDQRSDIFSLGTTLYEVLCGQRPFEGQSASDVLSAVREGRGTPLRQRKPDLSPAIVEVVERAMAHRPADRYQSAAEFADDIIRVLCATESGARALNNGPEPPAEDRKPRRRNLRHVAAIALTAAGICAVAGLFWLFGNGRGPAPTPAYTGAYASLEAGDYTQLATVLPTFKGLWRDELAMALAFYRGEPIEADESAEQTPYIRTLRALEAIARGQNDKAASLLEGLDEDSFAIDLQRRDFHRAKGQLALSQGDNDAARKHFEAAGSQSGDARDVAEGYLRLAKARLQLQKEGQIRERIGALRKALDQTQPEDMPTPEQTWTRRMPGFFVLDTDAGNSVVAGRLGMTDVLPMLLGDALAQQEGLKQVEREMLDLILAEQELSALSSDSPGALRLGQVVGANVIVQVRFGRIGAEEFALPRVVNVETTESIQVGRVSFEGAQPTRFVDDLAREIAEAVRGALPLRGIIEKEGGALMLNLGQEEGLAAGAVFSASARPDPAFTLEGVEAVVTRISGPHAAEVSLQGSGNTLPEDARLFATLLRRGAK